MARLPSHHTTTWRGSQQTSDARTCRIFSKVSALRRFLYKATIESTLENALLPHAHSLGRWRFKGAPRILRKVPPCLALLHHHRTHRPGQMPHERHAVGVGALCDNHLCYWCPPHWNRQLGAAPSAINVAPQIVHHKQAHLIRQLVETHAAVRAGCRRGTELVSWSGRKVDFAVWGISLRTSWLMCRRECAWQAH